MLQRRLLTPSWEPVKPRCWYLRLKKSRNPQIWNIFFLREAAVHRHTSAYFLPSPHCSQPSAGVEARGLPLPCTWPRGKPGPGAAPPPSPSPAVGPWHPGHHESQSVNRARLHGNQHAHTQRPSPAFLSASQALRKQSQPRGRVGNAQISVFLQRKAKEVTQRACGRARGLKPALSRAHDGCRQSGIMTLLLTVANSRRPAKSGKNKTREQCFPTTLPASSELLLKVFPVSLYLIPLNGSSSCEFFCFSDKCKNTALVAMRFTA